jgi:hypothetical protein
MTTILPVDGNNAAIPVLSLRTGASHSVAVTATSARNATAFNAATRVIGLYATVPMFIRIGNNTATAVVTDHYLPAETYMDISVASGEDQIGGYVAAIRATSDGTLHMSEKY